jgi:hypothetical protein
MDAKRVDVVGCVTGEGKSSPRSAGAGGSHHRW